MGAYIVNRLWTGLITLFLVTFLVFGLLNLLPGDIVGTLMGDQGYTQAEANKIRHELGLDKPIATRYVLWVGALSHGDFGQSLVNGRPVSKIIRTSFPVSIELAFIALIISSAVGIPFGVYSAIRQDAWDDYAARLVSIVGYSTPAFWLGTVVIVFPAIWWGWVPPLFFVHIEDDPIGNLGFMIVPALVLAAGAAARNARLTRSQVLETLREDYVRTARAKGITGVSLISRHVLRNALLPVITQLGGSVIFLISGAVVVETIFSIPGIGTTLLSAIQHRDYPVISGVDLVIAVLVIGSHILIDLSYKIADPRVTY
ncbi:MAG TPA: ABC transporter permease [Dehalococcoidia bacterium]|nr:ABC transporter permease [Dehalococcoidia bacterium]